VKQQIYRHAHALVIAKESILKKKKYSNVYGPLALTILLRAMEDILE